MLSTASQDTITIVTEFGKFRYNNILMVMCALGDIFQDKVDKIIGDIEVVKTYTVSILVLSKESFSERTDHLIVILSRIRDAALKSNARKCSFGLKDITYLGYVITREVIKPIPKKVQGIMDIGRPATNTEA